MSDVLRLLGPKWRTAANGARDRSERIKSAVLGILVLGVCVGIFLGAHHVLEYIKDLYIGDFLELKELRFEINRRLLGMIVLTFLAVLIFSNIVTALTTFFMSGDLQLVAALPVSKDSLFVARFIEMTVDSSWMVALFGTPVYVAFGAVYDAGPLYYLSIPLVILPFIMAPAGLGVIVTMSLVSAFPARRIRDILFLLAVFGAGILFLLLRLLQPENLANPDTRLEVLDFIATLQAPSKVWMPSHWVTEVLSATVKGGLGGDALAYFGLLWTTGLGVPVLALLFARVFYRDAFSKSLESTRVRVSRTGPVNRMVEALSSPFQRSTRQMVMKDLKVFMRDTSQWSQVILLVAMMVIYLFNFMVIDAKLEQIKFNVQSAVSYGNIALAGFVVSALAARFVFPMVSLEGRAFWIVKTSPLSLRGFLWSKFLMSAAPLLIIGETLIVVTNIVLGVDNEVWYVGVYTMFGMTFAICGLGVGLGARYPKFNIENPAKVATSFGGVAYMVTTLAVIAFVVLVQGQAMAYYVMSKERFFNVEMTPGLMAWIAASFAIATAAMVAATFIPMRIGLRWIEDLEVH